MPDVVLDLRYLRYAILVAQHGSFRAAAESLNLSQSTVSRRVQILERRLGATLFERSYNGVKLTAAGQRFIQEATVSVAQILQAIEEVRGAHRGEIGEIHIGLMVSLTTGFLADLLGEFRDRFPKVEIRVQETNSEYAAIRLFCNALDVALLPMVQEIPGCQSVQLWEEKMYCAMSRDHRLAGRDVVTWDDLAEEVFLVPAGGAGAELDKHFLRRGSAGGKAPRYSLHDVGRENLLNLVGDGFGISLVLSSATGGGHREVVFVPLSTKEETVSFSIVWSRNNPNLAIKRFVDLAVSKAGKAPRSKVQ